MKAVYVKCETNKCSSKVEKSIKWPQLPFFFSSTATDIEFTSSHFENPQNLESENDFNDKTNVSDLLETLDSVKFDDGDIVRHDNNEQEIASQNLFYKLLHKIVIIC